MINVLDNVVVRVNPITGRHDATGFEEGLSQTPTISGECYVCQPDQARPSRI